MFCRDTLGMPHSECPVCGRSFSSHVIETHVNSCLSNEAEKNEEPAKKRKSMDWDFLTKSQKGNPAQSAKVARSVQSKGKAKVGSVQKKSHKSLGKDIELRDHEDSSSDVEFIDCDNNDRKMDCNDNKVHEEVTDNEIRPTLQHKSTFEQSTNKSTKLHDHTTGTTGTMDPAAKSTNASFGAPKKAHKITSSSNIPLAERVRPKSFDNFVGQDQAVGKKSLLHTLLSYGDSVPSMVLWGPPGCGKTTLAKIIAEKCKERGNIKFITMSATSASVSDVKEAAKIARNDLKMFRKKTVLFLDEIHRFNKTQQDVLLPHVEDGTITLIGATTENPSFQVNGALLSRCRVITLAKLEMDDIKAIIKRALTEMGATLEGEEDVGKELKEADVTENGTCNERTTVVMERDALDVLAGLVDGDARTALNGLQLAVEGSLVRQQQGQEEGAKVRITVDVVKEALQRSHVLYDKTGEEHYNTVSALIKSLRGSDASAALYWMTRMIEGGENPLFVARRLVIFASEDVGNADPQALNLAVSTHQACHFIGMPECVLNLTQCVIYLARAPKSNEVVRAMEAARDCVKKHEGPLPPVPLHLRNAPTKLMKSLGYSKGYKYPPNFDGPIEQDYFPPCLKGTDFFSNSD